MIRIRNLIATLALTLFPVSFSWAGPVDKDATAETVALYHRLVELQSKGTMIGHQDAYLYGHGWKYDGVPDVKQVAGDYPAVFGWELGELGLGKEESLDGIRFEKIREGIEWVHANGGVNTISWHTVNPFTGGDSWDTSSDKVVASVLPGGSKEEVYAEMLDRLARFLLSAKTEEGGPVPVIFRPYHEHTGSWFWWGQKLCTTEEYLELWKYTIEFLQGKGVHNVLWAYSAASGFDTEADFLERYPGDEYIDIVGFDIYQRKVFGKGAYMAGLKKGLDIVSKVGRERGKIVILAETGLESVPDPEWWTGTLWSSIEMYPLSYVLFWRNAYNQDSHHYMPYPGHKSAEDFKEFAKLPRTLFLEDVR
ncbi:glycoside hydrolase family 26 protein [Pelagicoccus mobilis]|uniref:Mannan endo-1,4-beta-mannosidase n=1 Tax=Pelagicoccus mobilis TaxID=415221 RepID=A0A934RW13_9BACT|nr:glycosyl hydrolase [Pelagicoccus mobilis]MBK1878770.1 hypothetical protein [Pelagicoccus mobilis]